MRAVGVERHAIADPVESGRERGGCRPLLLVHRSVQRSGLGSGSRDVEEDEHGEIAPATKAVDVDRLVGRGPGDRFDVRLDRGVDVDVIALRLAMGATPAHAEAGERSTQAAVVGHPRRRVVSGLRLDLLHRAPVRAVAPAVDVPLGVLRPPGFDGGLFRRLRQGRRPPRAAVPRSGAGPVRRRVGARRTAALQLAHHSQHPPEQAAERASAADRARKGIGRAASVVFRVVRQLGEYLVALLGRNAFTRRRRAVGAAHRRQQLPCSDRSEVDRRVVDRLPAQRGSQGSGGRVGARRDLEVDERAQRGWQQVPDRGQRSVSFHGEVSPGQCRAPCDPADDAGLEASGCEQRRLHDERLELVARAELRIDEDRAAVGPRRLAALAGGHLQGAPGERGRQQAEPPRAVALGCVTPQRSVLAC